MTARDVQITTSPSLIDAARRVAVELARRPVLAGPGLPRERRVVGVDADAFDAAREARLTMHDGHRLGQPDQQHVVRLRRRVEAEEAGLDRERVGVVSDRLAVELRGDARERAGDDRRSSVVQKTIGFLRAVRAVATSVPDGMVTVAGCGAESQNVTGAWAAAGGNSGRRSARGT